MMELSYFQQNYPGLISKGRYQFLQSVRICTSVSNLTPGIGIGAFSFGKLNGTKNGPFHTALLPRSILPIDSMMTTENERWAAIKKVLEHVKKYGFSSVDALLVLI